MSLALGSEATPPTGLLTLWYREPATMWTDALPIGNGRLGAMIFGGVQDERLQFNEDSLWTGGPHEYQHKGAVQYLPQLRQLLFAGKQKEAEDLAMEVFMSVPLHQSEYQPCGDLLLKFPDEAGATEYRRDLDLDSAIASVRYRIGDVVYTRETFASHPDQVIVVRISGSKPGAVSFAARLTSPHPGSTTRGLGRDGLALTGGVKDGAMRFEARLKIISQGGRVTADDGQVTVEGADAATVLLAAATNLTNFHELGADPARRCAAVIATAAGKDFATLRAAHVADHRALFRRVTFDLGTSPAATLPTDQRLAAGDKNADPQLLALSFQFGRYLLIASSRPGGQPANLQGLWNDQLNPPWGSKYTTNINAEMNYWPAEVANLSECTAPLFALLDDIAISGRKTAREQYGARGWVLHHNTDLWRGTAPINASNHGIWPTGGAWLCLNLWEHYQYTGDRVFLAQRGYPLMKGAAQFFADYLVKDPKTGWLISGPSNSPEQGGLVMGPTMDHQIIRTLFANTARAAGILDIDHDFAAQLTALRQQIAPNQIGHLGQLQEWLEDRDDPNNHHRHVSHLWGVFPGNDITRQTPDLLAAAKQSLIFRGDDGTGWSLGWKICLWARLGDGDHALRIMERQLRLVREQSVTMEGGGGTYPNLFDAHPPFQIDGNFAATAGMSELLLQSHLQIADANASPAAAKFEIDLLPALPAAWRTGSVRGLRARGGFEVAMTWDEGRLTSAEVHSLLGNPAVVRYGGELRNLELPRGGTFRW